MLGKTADQAFNTVKKTIIHIIEEIQSNNLDSIQKNQKNYGLWPIVVWKIAFLYQDRTNPQIISVYKRDKLIEALGNDASRLSTAELYRRLMAQRNGKNLH